MEATQLEIYKDIEVLIERNNIPLRRDTIKELYILLQTLVLDKDGILSNDEKKNGYLNFLNGILSIPSLELLEHNKDLGFKTCIGIDYKSINWEDPNTRTEQEQVDKFFNVLFDNDKEQLRFFQYALHYLLDLSLVVM